MNLVSPDDSLVIPDRPDVRHRSGRAHSLLAPGAWKSASWAAGVFPESGENAKEIGPRPGPGGFWRVGELFTWSGPVQEYGVETIQYGGGFQGPAQNIGAIVGDGPPLGRGNGEIVLEHCRVPVGGQLPGHLGLRVGQY